MWACRFHYWIIYEENDRHAACVPNVNTCATGRSPMQTTQSVPLVQLWVMGSGADSWAQGFFTKLDRWEHLLSRSVESRSNSTSDTQSRTFKTLLTWALSCGEKFLFFHELSDSKLWSVTPNMHPVSVFSEPCRAAFPISRCPRGGTGQGMSESQCGEPLM